MLIIANYQVAFEREYLNVHIGKPKAYLYFFLFYGTVYYLIALVQSAIRGTRLWRKPLFWIKSAVFVGILAINAGSAFHFEWLYGWEGASQAVKSWLFNIALNAGSFFLFAIPLLITWWLWDREDKEGWYGLQRKGFYPAPYLILLLGMLPLIIWASYQSDFLDTYPIYWSDEAVGKATGLGQWGNTLIFQLAYALDFVTVELLFRGALIIGLSKIMGREALLPMVAVYCVLHFGKPMGEAISSIFGGYILGVIALYGRNIWGGVLIHVGVALLMEWAAILQKG